MPAYRTARFLYEIIICFHETPVFLVLHEVIMFYSPFCFRIFRKPVKTLILLSFFYVKKYFQHHITAVTQLTLKLIHFTQSVSVFIFCYLVSQIFPHYIFHPTRIKKSALPATGGGSTGQHR